MAQEVKKNEEIRSFDGLIKRMGECVTSPDKEYNGALQIVTHNAEIREMLHRELDGLGIKSFSFIARGKEAFIAKISDEQVIRVSSNLAVEPLQIPEVLQPVFSKIISSPDNAGLRIEVLPYLKNQGITKEHKEALCIAISKRGFYFTDPKLHTDSQKDQNVMLLPDGTPIVVDREAASYETDDPFVQMEREGFNRQPSPNYTWEGKQEKYFPEIKSGKIITYPPVTEQQTAFVERLSKKPRKSELGF